MLSLRSYCSLSIVIICWLYFLLNLSGIYILRNASHDSVATICSCYKRPHEVCFSNYLSKRAVNNTVLMMMMDYGFIHLWNSSYLSRQSFILQRTSLYCAWIRNHLQLLTIPSLINRCYGKTAFQHIIIL